jgi:hypothetical protein
VKKNAVTIKNTSTGHLNSNVVIPANAVEIIICVLNNLNGVINRSFSINVIRFIIIFSLSSFNYNNFDAGCQGPIIIPFNKYN